MLNIQILFYFVVGSSHTIQFPVFPWLFPKNFSNVVQLLFQWAYVAAFIILLDGKAAFIFVVKTAESLFHYA